MIIFRSTKAIYHCFVWFVYHNSLFTCKGLCLFVYHNSLFTCKGLCLFVYHKSLFTCKGLCLFQGKRRLLFGNLAVSNQ